MTDNVIKFPGKTEEQTHMFVSHSCGTMLLPVGEPVGCHGCKVVGLFCAECNVQIDVKDGFLGSPVPEN